MQDWRRSTLKAYFWQLEGLQLALRNNSGDSVGMMLSHRALVQTLERHLGDLECVVLFGSRADGTANNDSDIDLAVAAARPLTAANLAKAQKAMMGETGLGVDVIDLRDLSLSPILLREAITRGITLQDATGCAVFERLAVIMREYEDFRRCRALVEDGLVAGLAHHATP